MHGTDEDTDGSSLSMEYREAFVLKNVVVKKDLEMQDNPEIGPSTELGQILREILKKGKISIVNFQRR